MVAVLASVPSNVEGGSYMTFGGPVGLFCIVGAILWLLLFRQHRRVPPRQALIESQAGAGNVSSAPAAASSVQPAGAAAAAAGGTALAADVAAADGSTQAEQDTSTTTEGTEASE